MDEFLKYPPLLDETGRGIVEALANLNTVVQKYVDKHDGYVESSFIETGSIYELSSDRIVTVGNAFLKDNYNISIVDLPNLKSLGSQYNLVSCTNLKYINLPQITDIPFRSLTNMPKLEYINIPNVKTIGYHAFDSCPRLKKLELPSIISIDTGGLESFSNLHTLIMSNSNTICKASSSSLLSDTPISKGTGYIYVPDELVDQYKTATNWSVYANQIKPLSEYVESEV